MSGSKQQQLFQLWTCSSSWRLGKGLFLFFHPHLTEAKLHVEMNGARAQTDRKKRQKWCICLKTDIRKLITWIHVHFQECCICLSSYVDGEELRTLPCNHHFHCGCISRWLQINSTCPLCKFDILRRDSLVWMESDSQQGGSFFLLKTWTRREKLASLFSLTCFEFSENYICKQ